MLPTTTSLQRETAIERSNRRYSALLAPLLVVLLCTGADWPRWRGPNGNAVADGAVLPLRWSDDDNVRWRASLDGEGSSSPIVVGSRLLLTSSLEDGYRRRVHCLDAKTGKRLWTREVTDENPEITSSLTGHAASTLASDGKHVVAFFVNAGAVCFDLHGAELWRKKLGDFQSELGLASSPIIDGGRVVLVCDHDGDRFDNFDSFLIALDVKTGKTIWKTNRRGLFRSWSTPILVRHAAGKPELIVAAQDQLRGYDPLSGRQLWRAKGLLGWVAPSPVFGDGKIFATSGKNGAILAVKPGGRGDVSESQLAWMKNSGGPYVCSPLFYRGLLYVHNSSGVLSCYAGDTGKLHYRKRLSGKFTASAVAADGKIYLTNEDGVTYVMRAGAEFQLAATNRLTGKECLASPAIANGSIYLRFKSQLFCIGK